MRVSLREMRAVFAALAANLGIALAKFIAFLITGSASMLAESVHSVADTGNEVLLIVGRGRSIRPRSEEHPFGFGRERYFYGFVVSVMLFTVGAVFSVYDGLHKILNPEPVRSPQVAFAVLGLSELAMDGEHLLVRLAGVIQLADYASVYLAVASGIDPGQAVAITDLSARIE